MRDWAVGATIGVVVMDRGRVAEKFDRRAPSYDQSASHRWQAFQAVNFFAPTRAEWLLDVATGTGLTVREAVPRLGRDGAIVGTDIATGMLKAARQAVNDPPCWFVRAAAAASPFASGVFDGVLRDAAAGEGIGLADPGGPLAVAGPRARVLAAPGWQEDRVAEVVFEQPPSDPAEAFGWADSGFAEPLRTSAEPVRERVWRRFEALYTTQTVEEHRVLLVRAEVSPSVGDRGVERGSL